MSTKNILNQIAVASCPIRGTHRMYWWRGGRTTPVILVCPQCRYSHTTTEQEWASLRLLPPAQRVLPLTDLTRKNPNASVSLYGMIHHSICNDDLTPDLNTLAAPAIEDILLGRKETTYWEAAVEIYATSLDRYRFGEYHLVPHHVVPVVESMNALGWVREQMGYVLDTHYPRTLEIWKEQGWTN